MSPIDHIRLALARPDSSAFEKNDISEGAARRAAVAMVFAGQASSWRLCFVERSYRQGDRWSGDMAFPGGWAKGLDEGYRAAAIRETREEVGLDLERAQYLGALPPMPISRFDSRIGTIAAGVFYLGDRCLDLHPDGREIRKAFWIPDAHLNHRDNHVRFCPCPPPFEKYAGYSQARSGIEFEGRLIWGLTYRLLARLKARIDRRVFARAADGAPPEEGGNAAGVVIA